MNSLKNKRTVKKEEYIKSINDMLYQIEDKAFIIVIHAMISKKVEK